MSKKRIVFVSHIESIKDRDTTKTLESLSKILSWNSKILSEFDGVNFVIATDRKCIDFLEGVNEFEYFDVATASSKVKNEIIELKGRLAASKLVDGLNYGLEFESKCFERFFYFSDINVHNDDAYLFHLDCDFVLSFSFVSEIIEYVQRENFNGNNIIAPTETSSYLLGMSYANMMKFNEYLLKEYIGSEAYEKHRVCDMNALSGFIDKYSFTLDRYLFEKYTGYIKRLQGSVLAIHAITKELLFKEKIELNPKNNLPDEAFTKFIAEHKEFFNFVGNRKIYLNGELIPFVHFHGWSKRYINFLIKDES